MNKNTAGQTIGVHMLTTAGAAFTGAVTCYVTIGDGAQALGEGSGSPSGLCEHKGNGYHVYTPTQAETNGDHIAFTFVASGAVPQTVQAYPTAPQGGDAYALLLALLEAAPGSPGEFQFTADALRAIVEFVNVRADYSDEQAAQIQAVTAKLDTMLELTAASPGEYEFTADSLRNAPSGPGGGGGGLDEAGVRAALGMASANLDDQLAAIKSDTAATLVDTAEIGAAGAGLTALATAANLATVAGYLDTEIADIKAKTDLIPASPAAVSDIPTATENADALLNRDMSAVSDTTARSPLNALRFLRNKWGIVGTTLTVTKEDDSTSAWTAQVSTSSGADPVTGTDPA